MVLRVIFLSVVLSLWAIPAQSQQSTDSSGTVVYSADYFSEWAPITAQDMLLRIPGQENSGPGGGGGPGGNPASGGRGLGGGGSGTEILVNGKRTAGKNNDASGLLSSIAANQVREIRIIRGTSGELDVRGSAQVVNIILFEQLASSSIAYELQTEYIQDDTIQPNGSVSLSGMSGGLNYLLSFERRARYQQQLNNESSILGDFSPNDTVLESRIRDVPNNELSLNIGYELTPQSSVRFNALYGVSEGATTIDRVTTNLRTAQPSYLVEYEDNPSEGSNWEIGGDYEYSFDNGDRFKLLAIANQDDQVNTRQRFQVLPPDDIRQLNLFLNTDAITEERIVRGSWTTTLFGDQSVEFGVEGAQTILDSRLRLGSLTAPGTPSADVGGLNPVAIPNAASKVEEIRYEPFAIHNWRLNSQMTLESTLIYETSEINQTGDVTRSRDFAFVKPKVDLRYDVSPALQLRGTIERIVNQLSFSDFVASNDQTDEDAETIAGNADLRQQTQWRYSLNTEYRFPNDMGVINAELFYAAHQDVIDWIDVSTGPNNLRSTRGNIGDGVERVLNINASVRAGFLGMPNLLLMPGLNLQDSKVTDPFLGIERRFQNHARGRFTFTFRHDLPQWNAFWGMQYFDRTDGNMFAYDVEDIEFNVGEPRVNFYAQYMDPRGVTVRFDVGAITDGTQCRERWRYVGHIRDNILEELEYRCTHTGVETSLTVNGTF